MDLIDVMSHAFEDELQKIAAARELAEAATKHKSTLIPLVAGGALALGARQVNEDRKIGRQIRLQQQQGY